jgi:ArsR family transcriptional regulator
MPGSDTATLDGANPGAELLTHQQFLMDDPGMALATKEVGVTARLFRALGDETRLRLIEQFRGGEQCVCDLTDELDASQPRLSFHLKTLKDAGLVIDRRQGRWVYYALNAEAFASLDRLLGDLRPTRSTLRVVRRCD